MIYITKRTTQYMLWCKEINKYIDVQYVKVTDPCPAHSECYLITTIYKGRVYKNLHMHSGALELYFKLI